METPQRRIGAHLHLDGVTIVRGPRRVIDSIDLTVAPGQRVGLIGANGAGKSSLIAVASGRREAESGLITAPESLGVLEQELAPEDDRTVADVIESALAPLRRLEAALEQTAAALADDPQAADRYDVLLRQAESRELWTVSVRVDTVIDRLQLGAVARDRALSQLSGGQRRRLALAALLIGRPEALLLDEPTNHLDDDAVDFVEQELRGWRGPVLMASHDRAFLDAVATGIVDLDPTFGPHGPRDGVRQGRRFTGGFSAYMAQRDADLQRWCEAYAEQSEERARLERVISTDARNVFHTTQPRGEGRVSRKFEADRAAKTVGGRVRQARTKLAALDRNGISLPPTELSFTGFAAPATDPAADGVVAVVREARVSGRLAPVSLVLDARDRLLLEGRNGAGKSTLLALLAHRLRADAGEVDSPRSVGLLTQDEDWEDLGLSADDAYRARLRSPERAPSLEELGLLSGPAAHRPLRELSYGQRRRAALGSLIAEPPGLLLLDEPTNHLALELAESLERALPDYPGCVVVASHDRWLRERWTGRHLVLRPAAEAVHRTGTAHVVPSIRADGAVGADTAVG